MTKEQFSAEDFLQNLLEDGTKCPCDESVDSFNQIDKLPTFYDEATFKRGQKFFNDNICALLYSKFLSLLLGFSIVSLVQILTFTKKSSSPLAAYKRYLSTVFHTCIWYQSDFTPGSRLWRSLTKVKNAHNFVSKRCFEAGLGRITQKDMVLAQLGFMGAAVLKRENVGLHKVCDEDWKAFIHIWRVIGYLMGIEDRFNICRDSVEETRSICNLIEERIIKPAIDFNDKNFIKIATNLSEGMWCMNVTLDVKVYLNLGYKLLQSTSDNNPKMFFIELTLFQLLLFHFIRFVIWALQFTPIRVFCNYWQYFVLWTMKHYPLFAYYRFGYSNSHIKILE